MKKLLSVLSVFVIIFGLLIFPAQAAGSGNLSMGTGIGNRGDTVSLRVNLGSNSGLVTMTIRVSYDTSVLQLTGVSDSGLLAGAQLSGKYGSPYTISWVDGATTTNNTKNGTIATFTFKILDTAKVGDSTVTLQFIDSYDTDYNENSFSAASGKVTVKCSHSYGNWSDAGNGQHSRICSHCSEKETTNHTWNGGSVTKQPSCKETGTKTYTCTTCSATKTDSVDKTTDHKYGTWTKANDATHNRTCSVCFKEETANHNWNSGSVTKQPSCKENGTKTHTCTICNATKQDPISKLTTHTYDNGCDASCNVCGETRTVNHTYKTSCDKTSHWQECSLCKDKKSEAAHTPGAAATETKAQTCTTCDYVINPALGHKHSYAASWTADNTGHWHACTGCAEKGSGAAHKFENACDKDCSVCGFTRGTDHAFAEAWTTDENNHWHLCTACGLQQAVAAHEPGPAATATTAQVCTICSMEMAPALGIPETTEATEPSETVEPTETTEATVPVETEEPTETTEAPQSTTTETKFPFWIPITVIAFLLCIAAAVVIIKKR